MNKKDNLTLDIIIDKYKKNKNIISSFKSVGGMTNNNYKININEEVYIVRIPGKGSNKLIDRVHERENSEIACELDISNKIVYFDVNTGIKASKFIKSNEIIDKNTIKSPYNIKTISDMLKRLHTSNKRFECEFDVFEKINLYEKLIIDNKGEFPKDYENLKKKVFKLKAILDNMHIKKVACHNDTVPENFLKDEYERIYLIDWEYSGMNDPMWDLAALFLESDFHKKEEYQFLDIYFNGKISKEIEERILIYKILQDFLWSIWTIFKEIKGDDFGIYGMKRYNGAKENLKLLQQKYNIIL